jgi:F-type H+-transporting ATPase subunit b
MLTFPPDWTFIFQIILFLVLWTFLRRFLFEPHLAVLDNRKERSAGALQEAGQVRAEAEQIAEQYRTSLTQARAGATQQIDVIYRSAETESGTLLDAARAEAARTIAGMQDALQRELVEARQSLDARVPEFSRSIAEKLLGRPLTNS